MESAPMFKIIFIGSLDEKRRIYNLLAGKDEDYSPQTGTPIAFYQLEDLVIECIFIRNGEAKEWKCYCHDADVFIHLMDINDDYVKYYNSKLHHFMKDNSCDLKSLCGYLHNISKEIFTRIIYV